MKKIIYGIISVTFLIFIILYGLYYFSLSDEEKYFSYNLKKQVYNGNPKIYIKDVTDFAWDKICIHSPYSSIFLYDNLRNTDYDKSWAVMHEESWVISFHNNEKLIKIFDINQYVGNIKNDNNSSCVAINGSFELNNNRIIKLKED